MEQTTVSEMQRYYFGGRIFFSDGEDGVLSHVYFDPATRRLTHIAVKLGRLFGKTVYLPFASVVDATGNGIHLNITRDDGSKAGAAAPVGAMLDNKSVVHNTETAAKGTLHLVATEPGSGALAYLVAHHLRPGQDTLLRQDVVAKIETGSVTVAVPDATLQTLPPYRSDDQLQREVENILFDLGPLHVDFPGMTIRVLDSVLYLDGNISSSLRGDIVVDQAVGVQGLLDIKNRLVGDDTLASNLAMALGRDPRTRDLPIGVYPRLGVVRLSGAVHNDEQKAAATEIARDFPGVRSVANDLVVDAKAELLNVMASSAGGEAEDKVPGKYIRHTK